MHKKYIDIAHQSKHNWQNFKLTILEYFVDNMYDSVGGRDIKSDAVALSGWRPDADVVVAVPRHGDLLTPGGVQDGLAGRDVLGEDGSGNNVTQEDSGQGRFVGQQTLDRNSFI